MGNVVEILHRQFENEEIKIKILPDRMYMDLETGEIKDMITHDTRADLKQSLRRTFRKLRQIINTNCSDSTKVHFITLTYKENMTDQERLYKDFKNFMKKFRCYVKKMGFDQIEYISVVEPQQRGAWHCHVLMIYAKKRPYIENDKIKEIWGYGFVSITKIDSVDDIGSYLTAYLTDVEISELDENFYQENSLEDVKNSDHLRIVEGEKGKYKAYIKGYRLSYYPPNFNLYRRSKGIKEPEVEIMTYEEALKKVSDSGEGMKTFEKSYFIRDGNNEVCNVITKEYYNMVRKKKP